MTETTTDLRPLVTFALFAYNQEEFIQEAVLGAFAQTYSPLEIILSDDCSTDKTFGIMQELVKNYNGSHKVILRKNEVNFGLAKHVNTVFSISKGEFIAVAAGDDISESNRCEVTVKELIANDKLSFIDTSCKKIDKNGEFIYSNIEEVMRCEISLNDLMAGKGNHLIGATRVYRSAHIMKFPPLEEACPTEDSTSVLRCLMVAPCLFMEDQLIKRRIHQNNLSGDESLKRMKLEEILKQYSLDCNYAFSNGFISKVEFKKIKIWTKEIIFKRLLKQKLQNKKITSISAMRLALTEPKIRIKARFALVKMIIKKYNCASTLDA